MARGADKPFTEELLKFFGCEIGAFSPVTMTEAKDGQLTLTGAEKMIALSFFGEKELAPFRGNDTDLEAKGLDARREFRIFPTGERVFPKLKYAKANGNELRLYFNGDEFKVPAGNFWAIFVKEGSVWLCEFSPWWLEDIQIGQTASLEASVALEPEEDGYQEAANKASPELVESVNLSWKRDPKLASEAFANANYKCELRPDLETFVSRATGKPFLEAHHLVPMKAQSAFSDDNLDTLENICVLSPFAHRKIHHAPFDLIIHDIKSLADARRNFLDELEISDDFLYSAYGA